MITFSDFENKSIPEVVKDLNKNILLYNTKESVINPNFIAKI